MAIFPLSAYVDHQANINEEKEGIKNDLEIKEKNADGSFVISAQMSVEKTFQLKFDAKEEEKVVDAPKELEPYLQGFKKEEIETNQDNLLVAADMASFLQEDRDNNIVSLLTEH